MNTLPKSYRTAHSAQGLLNELGLVGSSPPPLDLTVASGGDIRGAANQSHDKEQRLFGILEALPVAIYTTDAVGRITFFNQAAGDLWGRRPELGKDAWCGSWRLHWPDGGAMRHDECPMAVALRERKPINGAEAVVERPDGVRIPILAYPTPLIDETGALVGAVNMLIDITERKRAERAGELLSAIVESSHDAIISKNLDGVITSWNPSAERLFGYAAEEIVGKSITILIPSDRHGEELRILERIGGGARIDHYETVRRRKDGSLVEISLTVSPIRDARGRIVGASKIARDITELKQAQEQQNLLLKEMNHRVKNAFALASGVAALSARSAATPKAMAEALRERLNALSRAHDLTLPQDDGKAAVATTLLALVRTIVAPYVDIESANPRIAVSGPEVTIGAMAVTSLSLLLHEFATNAAKYGALSSPTGRVDIHWTVDAGLLLLTWRERGGPPVNGPPEREGFGSVLARGAVVGRLGGQFSRDWDHEGLIVHLSAPLASLAT